ncbi:MAG: sulfotransferase [Saprospiraceae bacterium]|nr:sulfotransferase [Saprospiraceae bacterium]
MIFEHNSKKYIFVTGLHRSGTTFLAELISRNTYVSSFSKTGFPKDEGQFLQTLMPTSSEFIAPGRFAFNHEAHLTENSKLLDNKEVLVGEWISKWDLTKPYLLEKSPPNLIRTRFLQEVFPNSKFITIIRHPIANSYAVKKWTNDRFLEILIKHWIKAHSIYLEDRKYLKNEICITYEDLTQNFNKANDEISSFLDLEIKPEIRFESKNKFYFDLWNLKDIAGLKFIIKKIEREYLIKKYENQLNKFGYSLVNLEMNNLNEKILKNAF